KALELGLRSTHFANAHGLPDPTGRSTAQDMARLIGHLVQDYPASRPLLGGASFIYKGRVHSRRIPLFQDPGGVQALKTGFTREAGYHLAIAAWREGQRFLLIVMGAQTRSLSSRGAKQLLRYGSIESGFEIAEEPRQPTPPPARRPKNERRRHALVPTRPAAVASRETDLRTRRRFTMAAPKAFIFDAYGTLFEVHSVVEAGRALTSDPQALSLLWRQKQLEYTWLRTLMRRYEDFWAGTEAALRLALGRLGIVAGDDAAA